MSKQKSNVFSGGGVTPLNNRRVLLKSYVWGYIVSNRLASLLNSIKGRFKNLTLIGNSVQGENPAPDNPQEIKSAGRKSKNLFNITKLKKGAGANYPTEIELVGETLIAKKDGGTANQMTFEIELENLEPNTTYEFTTKQTICKRKDSDTEKAGTIFSFKAYKNESQIENKGNVFTTGESESDIYKIILSVIAGDFGSLEYVKFEQPMLSHIKGAAYEPYSDKCLFDVQVTGKNLLSNKSADWQIGKQTSWSGYPDYPVDVNVPGISYALFFMNVKPSTKYTFVNKENDKLWVNRIIEREGKKGIQNHALYQNESQNYNKYTFITKDRTTSIIFQIKKADGTELLSTDIESIKIMLVEGEVNEPTPYEPYTEQSMQIVLDEPLRGVGEYKDVLTKDGVVRKIKRIVFDENTPFKEYNAPVQVKTTSFISGTTIKDATGETGIEVMSDRFKAKDRGFDRYDEECITLFGKNIFVRFNKDKNINTAEALTEWLKQNPLTVDYVLAEPVTEPLPESVQAQLQALHSENGTTHVFVDSGEVEAGISVTYKQKK